MYNGLRLKTGGHYGTHHCQTEKMLGRVTDLRIEHSPAIDYEPLLGAGYFLFI